MTLYDMLLGLSEYSNRPAFSEFQFYKWKMAVSKITETARERVQVGLKQPPLDVKEVSARLGK